MISLKHKFLFLHIPKTAGNSIQNILKDYTEERIVCIAPHQDGVERFEVRSDSYEIRKHSTLREYQSCLGNETMDEMFKFTCVRNPWERMISFFFSPHRGAPSWNRSNFIEVINTVSPVTDFISSNRNVESDAQAFNNIDAYIRFEHLQSDFDNICARIGISPVPLSQRNASKHRHYSTYYDNELVNLVGERFHKEINYFRFKFESTQKSVNPSC